MKKVFSLDSSTILFWVFPPDLKSTLSVPQFHLLHLNEILLSLTLLISLEQITRKSNNNFDKANVTKNTINDTYFFFNIYKTKLLF